MEEVHEKACSGVIYGARSVTKASETVAAAEVVCHALNEMSFFASSSEAASASARARVRASTRSDVLNLRIFRQSNSLV
jgi:hypothetical protein